MTPVQAPRDDLGFISDLEMIGTMAIALMFMVRAAGLDPERVLSSLAIEAGPDDDPCASLALITAEGLRRAGISFDGQDFTETEHHIAEVH